MSIVKLNNRGVRSVTAFGSLTSGSMTFIKKLTASSSSTLSFVDGSSDVVLDNTYKEYLFTFKNIHPATDNVIFEFQGNASGGSGYNETITSATFQSYHNEAGNVAELAYSTSGDQAQGTSFQRINDSIGNGNDESLSGFLRLFNPSDTTFVKHFNAVSARYHLLDYTNQFFVAGYFNTTSAIDEIQFKMSSGNIDAGDICLYGIN
tara:strand:+ start:154 stop:771 length:618 start_codon:yes stop_codon:yes gene_type:complete